jgi:hypothetical protein
VARRGMAAVKTWPDPQKKLTLPSHLGMRFYDRFPETMHYRVRIPFSGRFGVAGMTS